MDKAKFEQETKERREIRIDKFTNEILKEMLEAEMVWFSAHYVRNRSTQIIEETIKKLNFKNEAIKQARKAFLDVLLDSIDIYTWEDEIKQLKKDLKDPAKKVKAKERLNSLDRIIDGVPRDKTEERDLKCESICQSIAKKLLSKENLLDDVKYLEEAIELDNELLLSVQTYNSIETMFTQMYNGLDRSYAMASEYLWGCPREEITLNKIDRLLKDSVAKK